MNILPLIVNLVLTASDGLDIHVAVFEHENPKAVVQIVHGATEHKELYYPFAEYLNRHGYAVVLADNRGHGDSVNERYPLGHIEGIGQYVSDSYMVTGFIKEKYPDVPLYLFGHSLGSVIVRNYLQEHDDAISKLVMTGTANYIKPVNLGIAIGKVCTFFTGKYGHSKLLNAIGGSTIFNEMSYEENWVTTDEEFYREFCADAKTRFAWDNSGALTVFEGDSNLKKYKRFKCRNPELRIASFTGGKDPIVGGDEGLSDTVETLRRIGYKDVRTTVYPDDLHAVLFERDREAVYQDILSFLDE